MRRSYLGGVHPASYKESTRRKPIVPLEEEPKQVIIPLTMCSGGGAGPGGPARGPGDGWTGHRRAGGQRRLCPRQRLRPGARHRAQAPSLGRQLGRHRHRQRREGHPLPRAAGAHGLVPDGPGRGPGPDLPGWDHQHGGGASPTHLRLRQAVGRVDTLIVNAAECEPYLTADHRLLLEKGTRSSRECR